MKTRLTPRRTVQGMRPAFWVMAAILVLIFAGCAARGQEQAGARAGETQEAAARSGPPKIGLVFDVGGRGDGAFNDSAYAGLVEAARELGGRIVGEPGAPDYGSRFEARCLSSKLEGRDRAQLLSVLAEDGCRLVYAVGFLFADSVARVAREHPNTHFVLIDGSIPDLSSASNVTAVSFAEHEGSFLAGALAGYAASGNPRAKVGFIGGMDTPLIRRFQSGFAAGAAYAALAFREPGRILVQYVGKDGSAFADPKTAKAIAELMYSTGAEVVYHAAGGSGAGLFEAAREAGKLAIGVDSDQALAYFAKAGDPHARETGSRIVSSMLKRVDRAVFLTAKEFVERGAVEGGYRVYSLADGGVALARNEHNERSLAPYVARLDELSAKIVRGEIKVPETPEAAAAFIAGLK